MLTLLVALLCPAEFLTGSVFGAFAWAGLYIIAATWQKRDGWSIRLGALLFTCMLALATALLWADAYRHLGEVVIALLRMAP